MSNRSWHVVFTINFYYSPCSVEMPDTVLASNQSCHLWIAHIMQDLAFTIGLHGILLKLWNKLWMRTMSHTNKCRNLDTRRLNNMSQVKLLISGQDGFLALVLFTGSIFFNSLLHLKEQLRLNTIPIFWFCVFNGWYVTLNVFLPFPTRTFKNNLFYIFILYNWGYCQFGGFRNISWNFVMKIW